MKYHREFAQERRQEPKPLHKEYKPLQLRDGLTIIEHTKSTAPRAHSRAAECAKMGLNILLVGVFALGWASFFNLKFLPFAGGLAMIYVLCLIITPNESTKEL